MTADDADDLVEQAEKALTAGNKVIASELYERAALILSPTAERREIGHLLLLAAGYATDDLTRTDRLYGDAQAAFGALNNTEKLSEIAMMRGNVAKSAGKLVEAALHFTAAVQYAGQHIAEVASGHLACGEPLNFILEADDALNRLKYCRDRLEDIAAQR